MPQTAAARRKAAGAKQRRQLRHEVTERARAEAHVTVLIERLVTIEEAERRRLSRELHDQLGQELTALRLALSVMKLATSDRGLQAQLESADAIATRLEHDVDHLAWQLRPPALDEFGLAPTLEAFLLRWSEHHHITAHLDTSIGDARFDGDLESHLYRIVQEAMNNAVKHAQASRVVVKLERSRRHLLVSVQDDGHGFDLAATGGQGIGLVGIRERVALLGGRIEITSSIAHGTTLSVRVPLRD